MEAVKKLSEWNARDIVQWISGMNVLGIHAEKFASIDDYDELNLLTKEDLIAFGYSNHEAIILKNKIIALPTTLMDEPPKKTQVKQMQHYSVQK